MRYGVPEAANPNNDWLASISTDDICHIQEGYRPRREYTYSLCQRELAKPAGLHRSPSAGRQCDDSRGKPQHLAADHVMNGVLS